MRGVFDRVLSGYGHEEMLDDHTSTLASKHVRTGFRCPIRISGDGRHRPSVLLGLPYRIRKVFCAVFRAILRKPRTTVLTELRLENYAVIDNLVVEFGYGLNLLTGETGAGKSILIDALALLLGEKASTDVIRAGVERAVIAAVFEVAATAADAVAKLLEANGLDESDDRSLILRREISASGKGRVFVNNQPATVAVLRQLAPYLAIIHAQNE